MTLRPPLFVAEGATGKTAPQDARLALAGVLPVTGVLTGMAVIGSSSGPNMKYNVTTGTAVAARGTVAADGVYLLPNDGTFLVDSGTPAPSSGTRWDIIWVRAKNANDGIGDNNSTPEFGVTVGVAAASSPTKPYAAGTGAGGTSVPAGALALSESLVGTNIANAAAATLTRVVKPTGLRGAIIKVAGASEYPTSPQTDDFVVDAALGLMRFDGTNWQTYGKGGLTTWTDVPLNSGFAGFTQNQPQFRLEGGVKIYFRGAWGAAGITTANTTYDVATMPVGLRVKRDQTAAGGGSGGNTPYMFAFLADGRLQVRTGTGLPGFYAPPTGPFFVDV